MNKKARILIFDDSADLLEALAIYLERSYEVFTVTSKALFKTELRNFKPDMIILDVYINGITEGREICRIIKSETSTQHIPVLLMSASINSLKNFEECKADAVIDKPFDLKKLLTKITSLLNRNVGVLTVTGKTKLPSKQFYHRGMIIPLAECSLLACNYK